MSRIEAQRPKGVYDRVLGAVNFMRTIKATADLSAFLMMRKIVERNRLRTEVNATKAEMIADLERRVDNLEAWRKVYLPIISRLVESQKGEHFKVRNRCSNCFQDVTHEFAKGVNLDKLETIVCNHCNVVVVPKFSKDESNARGGTDRSWRLWGTPDWI